MFAELRDAFSPTRWWPPVHERLTLLINHVLAAEPLALARLRPHAGRSLEWRIEGSPLPGLPPLPPTRWRISPLGALEAESAEDALAAGPADLRLTVRLQTLPQALPALLAGQRPPVDIDGDAQLAADAAWLMDHLRWDLSADLERLVGPVPAQALAEAGRSAAAALRALGERVQAAWPTGAPRG